MNLRFLFDTGNPLGYSVATVIEYSCVSNVMFITFCILIIAIASCLLLISMTNDMQYSINTLNKCTKVKKKNFDIVQQFNDFIRFHSNAQQLSESIFLKISNFRAFGPIKK